VLDFLPWWFLIFADQMGWGETVTSSWGVQPKTDSEQLTVESLAKAMSIAINDAVVMQQKPLNGLKMTAK